MQATMDSSSSPVSQLSTRAAQQGWNTVFSLNEPDLSGISASTAANWYIQYINPLAISSYLPNRITQEFTKLPCSHYREGYPCRLLQRQRWAGA